MQKVAAGKALQSERAVRELRSRILSGVLPADSHISESAAAEMIGISRTPTREALAQLVEEGLLERTGSGRCTIRSLTPEDVSDAIELRGVIEGTILRIAAERSPAAGPLSDCWHVVESIDAVLAVAEAEIDFDSYAALNASFHEGLIALAGSPTLQREAARAYRMPLASPNAFLQGQAQHVPFRRSLFVAQAQHRSMLDAVERREGARAEALARDHARLARQNMEALIRTGFSPQHRIPGLSLVTGARPTPNKGRTP